MYTSPKENQTIKGIVNQSKRIKDLNKTFNIQKSLIIRQMALRVFGFYFLREMKLLFGQSA